MPLEIDNAPDILHRHASMFAEEIPDFSGKVLTVLLVVENPGFKIAAGSVDGDALIIGRGFVTKCQPIDESHIVRDGLQVGLAKRPV